MRCLCVGRRRRRRHGAAQRGLALFFGEFEPVRLGFDRACLADLVEALFLRLCDAVVDEETFVARRFGATQRVIGLCAQRAGLVAQALGVLEIGFSGAGGRSRDSQQQRQ
ncbi:hypothetical protein ebA2538 [Aromatoleum aromaticum EbN1]|uniref:Uncharacterized protein n=1 Tax=Aromatoleum aromaticum (strain DSM 19018 / LMG 30748 / EbN1) TaxID=76114 RepID=Q5P555_AROAE|nr:hypothetical protein ebA2538 [Aromatoleum aromaticum EbN1]